MIKLKWLYKYTFHSRNDIFYFSLNKYFPSKLSSQYTLMYPKSRCNKYQDMKLNIFLITKWLSLCGKRRLKDLTLLKPLTPAHFTGFAQERHAINQDYERLRNLYNIDYTKISDNEPCQISRFFPTLQDWGPRMKFEAFKKS